ncbi:MAG TPA: MFS transporter [Methylomirabilota bacterium]|nr:MFS transporter [Methylomirabilota bacterium]
MRSLKGAGSRLFRNRSFRALWLGQFISIFGDRLHYLALLALIVERAHDPGNPAPELALVPAVSFLPTILAGPLAGALVDTWDTRRVLVISDFLRGCIVLLIIPAVARGGLPAAFALVFLLYLANSFFLPARSSILPDLVESQELVEANSLATLAGVCATIAGSALGGILVERAGWRWGLAIDGLTYFVSVGFLASLRPRPRVRAPRSAGWTGVYRDLGRDVNEGFRLTVRNPTVLGPILALVLLWIAGGALHVAGTVLLKRRVDAFVSGTGGLLSAVGFGMVAGTLLTAWRGKRWPPRVSMAMSLVGIGVSLLLFSRAFSLPALLGVGFLAGTFVAVLLVTTESVVQAAVAQEARGRVFALRDFSTRVAVLVTAGLLGAALGRGWVDHAATVAGAGALLMAAGVWGCIGWKR